MALNVAKELAALEKMTVGELKRKFEEVFGEVARSGNKDWLSKRIAWRMQANAHGDLSERARRRAEELANDADLRNHRPEGPRPDDQVAISHRPRRSPSTTIRRLPMPGAVLRRRTRAAR